MPERFVDAHHHIWRQADLPWLNGPMQPRIFGPYDAIRRDYDIEEFRADAGPALAASVYVQANWSLDRALDEVRWVQAVVDRAGQPTAIVGYADLTAPDVDELLAAQCAAAPRLRGVRMQLHWHDNPPYRFAARADLMADIAFRHGFACLARHDLLFELQVFAAQMPAAAALARDHPETTMVLMHCGMPEDLSPTGLARWRDGVAELAACDNVSVKLSGLGTFVHAVDPDLIGEIGRETVALFGAERCLWGSNFPIEKLWTDYTSLRAAWDAAMADLSEPERRCVFHDTATRLYRLPVPG